jgi:hypothetical protein
MPMAGTKKRDSQNVAENSGKNGPQGDARLGGEGIISSSGL